jgi:hypothetical protein
MWSLSFCVLQYSNRYSTTELDQFESPRAHDLLALFKYFDFPDAFVGERLSSVTHSFGNYEWESGVECKYISTHKPTQYKS